MNRSSDFESVEPGLHGGEPNLDPIELGLYGGEPNLDPVEPGLYGGEPALDGGEPALYFVESALDPLESVRVRGEPFDDDADVGAQPLGDDVEVPFDLLDGLMVHRILLVASLTDFPIDPEPDVTFSRRSVDRHPSRIAPKMAEALHC